MSSYIDSIDYRHREPVIHSWRQHTYLNLAQQYGSWRAALIVDGKDPATQADIARWNALGRRSAA